VLVHGSHKVAEVFEATMSRASCTNLVGSTRHTLDDKKAGSDVSPRARTQALRL